MGKKKEIFRQHPKKNKFQSDNFLFTVKIQVSINRLKDKNFGHAHVPVHNLSYQEKSPLDISQDILSDL